MGRSVSSTRTSSPQDGVIIGMFPRFKDEITQNAQLARKYGIAKA